MGGGLHTPTMNAQRDHNAGYSNSAAGDLADMDSSAPIEQEHHETTTKKSSLNVLVTGFGPFPSRNGDRYEDNASHLITRLLPSSIPPLSALNPTNAHINIINPTAADGSYVRTEYAYVRSFVRELHEEYAKKVDLILHIGMANGWHRVTVERGAFKQGMSSSWWGDVAKIEYYLMPDDAGQTVNDLDPCPWSKVPMGLSTSLNPEKVAETAMWMQMKAASNSGVAVETMITAAKPEDSPILPIQPHIEAGPYLCGFIYYESMATCFVDKRKADVLFCHVPGETDEKSLLKGRNAILAVIGAAVGELLAREEE